jgi:hypothetical protein
MRGGRGYSEPVRCGRWRRSGAASAGEVQPFSSIRLPSALPRSSQVRLKLRRNQCRSDESLGYGY